MVQPDDSNQISTLKWALFNFRVIEGYKKYRIVFSLFTIISMLGICAFMVIDFALSKHEIEDLRKLAYLPGFFVSAFKGIYLIINSNKVMKLVNSLKCFWGANKFDKNTERQVKHLHQTLKFLCLSYLLFGYGITFILIATPLLDIEKRSLVYSDFAFCNLQSLYCWIPMYLWQTHALVFQIMPSIATFDFFFITYIGYIMTACKLLKIGLQKLNTNDLEKRRFILKEIVNQHVFMIEFLNALNNMYTAVMLLQFCCSFCSMILLLYMLVADRFPSMADFIAYGPLYVIIIIQIFIYATGGTIIEDQVQNITTDIFTVHWYERNCTDLRKDLALMIFRAQKTKILNVGKMSDLNYPLFIATIKNSISVVTLIRQLDHQELP